MSDNGERLENVHPGNVLSEDFLKPIEMLAERLAESIGVSEAQITGVLSGRRGVSPTMALRLSAFFETSARFWLNLQAAYDLEEAERRLGKRLARIRRVNNPNEKALTDP